MRVVVSAAALVVAAVGEVMAQAQSVPRPSPAPNVQLRPWTLPAPPPKGAVHRLPNRQAPPPVRCTMRIIPADPRIDPKMAKEPDASVEYAKKEVPPPACR